MKYDPSTAAYVARAVIADRTNTLASLFYAMADDTLGPDEYEALEARIAAVMAAQGLRAVSHGGHVYLLRRGGTLACLPVAVSHAIKNVAPPVRPLTEDEVVALLADTPDRPEPTDAQLTRAAWEAACEDVRLGLPEDFDTPRAAEGPGRINVELADLPESVRQHLTIEGVNFCADCRGLPVPGVHWGYEEPTEDARPCPTCKIVPDDHHAHIAAEAYLAAHGRATAVFRPAPEHPGSIACGPRLADLPPVVLRHLPQAATVVSITDTTDRDDLIERQQRNPRSVVESLESNLRPRTY